MHFRPITILARMIFVSLATLMPLLLAPGISNRAVATSQEAQRARVLITPRGGQPFFVIGANYEGPTDRAWAMWEDEKFDAALIEADFARARSLGINTLRIFVQTPLRDDIKAGDFAKVDAVTGLARKYGLWLILTFTDWAEPDVARAGALNARIASHLASEPSILAYDVKNEPQFTDVVGAIYPTGTIQVPMQAPELIDHYGERIAREEIGEYRRGEGRSIVPARMNDEQAYFLANYYKLYIEFLNAGSTWVGTHPGKTTLDYIDSPDSADWSPYIGGLDQTLAAWVGAQIDPVRAADAGRPVTVGYSNIIFAKLPSNRSLTFQSVHRFTSHGALGLTTTFRVLDNLQRTYAGQPVLLEEFGYPGQVKGSNGEVMGFDPRTTANLETAVWAYLYANGFAGGAKWMLNNFPQGYDPAQNSFGIFDNNGQPKIAGHALRELATLFSRSSPGAMSSVRADSSSAAAYSYVSPDIVIAGGKVFTGTSLIYNASAPAQLIMETGSAVSMFSTDVATASLNLPQLYGIPASEIGRISLIAFDPQGQPATAPSPNLSGDWLRISLAPLYRYRLAVIPRAVERAEARPGADSIYFPQTGHNLQGDFLHYWQTQGGLGIYGYPVTEPFTENGYMVQYFERNRFEMHPENQPPYNVLLGRLGATSVTGRTFPAVEPFASGPDHRYFPETRHSLNYAFLGYWERNGGLAQFGYPLSEEVRERSQTDGREYTVQYFERARMEYHPEYRGTPAEVLLGLLGVSTLKDKGWLP